MMVANHIVPRVLAALRKSGFQPELVTPTCVAVYYTGLNGHKMAVTVTCLPTKNKQGELILAHGTSASVNRDRRQQQQRVKPVCRASPRNIAKLGSVVASVVERNLSPTGFFLFIASQQGEGKGGV